MPLGGRRDSDFAQLGQQARELQPRVDALRHAHVAEADFLQGRQGAHANRYLDELKMNGYIHNATSTLRRRHAHVAGANLLKGRQGAHAHGPLCMKPHGRAHTAEGNLLQETKVPRGSNIMLVVTCSKHRRTGCTGCRCMHAWQGLQAHGDAWLVATGVEHK